MPVTHSVTFVVADADRAAANAYTEAMGWGSIFVINLSVDGQVPVTHYGAHDMRNAEFVATLLAAKASDDPALDALDAVFIGAVESQSAQFEAQIQSDEIEAELGTKLMIHYPVLET